MGFQSLNVLSPGSKWNLLKCKIGVSGKRNLYLQQHVFDISCVFQTFALVLLPIPNNKNMANQLHTQLNFLNIKERDRFC